MTTGHSSPERLFHEARAMVLPGEREGYLKGACGDDAALRSKVDALLVIFGVWLKIVPVGGSENRVTPGFISRRRRSPASLGIRTASDLAQPLCCA